jgi:hypothetical protein
MTRDVLQVLAKQGAADARVEQAKAQLLTPTCPLNEIFEWLDRYRKGYIDDTDLWRITEDFGGATSLSALASLIQDTQQRSWGPRGMFGVPGRLSFREAGTLLLPAGSPELDALRAAETDSDARNVIYLLQNSESCPRCGIRVQRDMDCAGCPTVTCPICNEAFRCFCVVGDGPSLPNGGLLYNARYRTYQLVDTAARAAAELEHSRKELAYPGGADLVEFSNVYSYLTVGYPTLTKSLLRRAFLDNHIPVSEVELDQLWARCADDSGVLTFHDFARQLKPR